MTDLTDGLKQNLKGKVCVIGIGNRLKGDDAAGPELIDRITGCTRFQSPSPECPDTCCGDEWRGDSAEASLRRRMATAEFRKYKRLHCLDAGVAPENYLEKIVQADPDTIVLVDAMDFNGEEGSCRLFPADQVTGGGLSSHALSLRMTCDYLQQRISARIFVLGIQPSQTNINSPLSAAVRAAVEKLAAELSSLRTVGSEKPL